jgi:ABC-type branched-subunit amino acid transport system substrate-binding protein
MRRCERAVVAVLVALSLGVAILAIGEAQQPFRIGASLAQTGPYAVPAQSQRRGYQLCVKHVNEKGGVLGRRLELIVEDDQSKAPAAVAIYEKLITHDKVDAILGPYGSSQWEAELVTLRAGGLIPIARQYPGASNFVESYRKEFPGAELSYHSAAGYGSCQVLVEAIRRAGSPEREKVRDVILTMDRNTVFGAFKVDRDGLQIAHKMVMFQWQDGKKVIVWPEELAPGHPRFPTPPWSQR